MKNKNIFYVIVSRFLVLMLVYFPIGANRILKNGSKEDVRVIIQQGTDTNSSNIPILFDAFLDSSLSTSGADKISEVVLPTITFLPLVFTIVNKNQSKYSVEAKKYIFASIKEKPPDQSLAISRESKSEIDSIQDSKPLLDLLNDLDLTITIQERKSFSNKIFYLEGFNSRTGKSYTLHCNVF